MQTLKSEDGSGISCFSALKTQSEALQNASSTNVMIQIMADAVTTCTANFTGPQKGQFEILKKACVDSVSKKEGTIQGPTRIVVHS